VLTESQATCPICGREASVEQTDKGMHLHFESSSAVHNRWTPEGLRKHMTDWVMATGPRFMAHRPEIKNRRKPYREMDIGWLKPLPDGKQKREGS
jgi:hypothetical protein